MMPPADYDATSLRKAIKVSTEFIEFRSARREDGVVRGVSVEWGQWTKSCTVKTRGLSPYRGLQDSRIGLRGILGANKVSYESNSCSSFYMHEFG